MPSKPVRNNPAQALMETELIARLYESVLWRRNPLLILLLGSTFSREYRIVSRALELQGEENILDLACGPGIYTRRFAEASRGHVFGMDLSGPMLRQASHLVQTERIQNIHFVQGDALTLPFPNGSFDVVNCAAALHLFGDLPATFDEVSRVLTPGGQFAFSTFRFPRNKLVRLFLHLRENRIGIRSFRQEDIEGDLRNAGLGEIRYLHTRAIWVVMHAQKPR